jgi:hypothetical protein
MQGSDVLPIVPPFLADDRVPCLWPAADEEAIAPAWPLHTPPLRYDVASLEHWLDLNA